MSNIVLKNLTFSNMFGYGKDNSVCLNSNSISQLYAENGFGKSTIALIIQELLFNKNVKGIKKTDIINRYVNDKYWEASLSFSADDLDYIVKVRRQGATTKVTLFENDVDISEHKVLDTYKKISNIIGMTFEVFSQLTYQSSVDYLEFLKATDANRKKFLIKLFNLEKYITIGEVMKAKATDISKELLGLEGELKSVEDFLNTTTIPEYKTEVSIPKINKDIIIKIAEISEKISNINSITKAIDANNLRIKERDALDFDISLEKPEDFKYKNEMSTLKFDLTKLQSEISQLKLDIANIDTTDICETCGQAINTDHLKEIKSKKTKLLNSKKDIHNQGSHKFIEFEKEAKRIYEENTRYINNKRLIEKFEQLTQLIDTSMDTEYPDIGALTKEKHELVATNAKEQLANEKAYNINSSIKAHNAKVDTLIEQKNEFKVRQNTLSNVILNKSSQHTNLDILKKAFSTTGIVAFKLENLTKELEININYYLALLSDGKFQIEFVLDKEKLNISVISDGKTAPIETTSGGEFSRIQTAILFAIRNVLAKLGGSSVNLLFLDEVMSVLDDAGKEGLIDILFEEQNINVFLISHEYTNPLIPKIIINKKDNISNITDQSVN